VTGWRKWFRDRDLVIDLSLTVVAVTAIVASFGTLSALATHVGWQGRTAWLLPCCIDALALGAGRVWLSGQATAEARQYARRVSLSALAVSVVGNDIGHIVSMEKVTLVKVLLAVAVGAVPPIALGAVGHLATLVALRKPEPVAEVETTPELLETAEPEPEPQPEPEPEAPPKPRRRRSGVRKQDVAWVFWVQERANGRMPSGADLAREADADPTSGCQWRRDWRAAEMTTEETKATLSLVTT
jgi:outer membrane biosynthesis protein TonB